MLLNNGDATFAATVCYEAGVRTYPHSVVSAEPRAGQADLPIVVRRADTHWRRLPQYWHSGSMPFPALGIRLILRSSGGKIRTCDLRVMSSMPTDSG